MFCVEWQHPFVNVFKLCGADQEKDKKDAEVSGKVTARMDEVIHKKVYKITGTIPAVNYLKLPKAKGFKLYGRFCYLQVTTDFFFGTGASSDAAVEAAADKVSMSNSTARQSTLLHL